MNTLKHDMNTLHNWANSVAIALVALVVLFGGHSAAPSQAPSDSSDGTPKSGNTTASFWNTVQGYQVNGTSVITSARALQNITTGSFTGNITSGTSNTATTSVASGCFQLTATTTANPLKLIITNTATTAVSAITGASVTGLAAIALFGTCP